MKRVIEIIILANILFLASLATPDDESLCYSVDKYRMPECLADEDLHSLIKGGFIHPKVLEKDCEIYALEATKMLFTEQPRYASQVHKVKKDSAHKVRTAIIARDWNYDTKTAFACKMIIEAPIGNNDSARTIVNFSVPLGTNGEQIIINDFEKL